ncbi:MAG: pirin family protein [Prevotellaceae bacterium]|jgi:redox-sensitive bicupin YhaK (pirin superfamily)|nr:pirin family protein [Prevotellaceae bacterium]
MSKHILHTAASRKHFNHGWLNTCHTFSFAEYYDPERISFGTLRVLNDDIVAAGEGFGMHPHANMEVISFPLEGNLEHRDSLGNVHVIQNGEVQTISAGTGIRHSECNQSSDEQVKFLQIWVLPDKKGYEPRYDTCKLDTDKKHNQWQQVISPTPDDDGAWIHQQAWFNISKMDKNMVLPYEIKKAGNGVYAFVIEGEFEVDGQRLNRRDGLGITETDKIEIKALKDNAEILLMEVPMMQATDM